MAAAPKDGEKRKMIEPDTNWIKAEVKRRGLKMVDFGRELGLTSDKVAKIWKGERRLSGAEILRIARLLDVEQIPLKGDNQVPRGFGEARATPWDHDAHGIDKVWLGHFAPGRKHLSTYLIDRDEVSLGLLRDDILVVDLGRKPATGETVVATIADPERDSHQTVLRMFLPPLLVPPDARQASAINRVDDESQVVGLMVPVVASFRMAIGAGQKGKTR